MLRFKPALVALLLDARGEALCDDCLARALRAAPADVTRTTGELSASPDFLKDVWRLFGLPSHPARHPHRAPAPQRPARAIAAADDR